MKVGRRLKRVWKQVGKPRTLERFARELAADLHTQVRGPEALPLRRLASEWLERKAAS